MASQVGAAARASCCLPKPVHPLGPGCARAVAGSSLDMGVGNTFTVPAPCPALLVPPAPGHLHLPTAACPRGGGGQPSATPRAPAPPGKGKKKRFHTRSPAPPVHRHLPGWAQPGCAGTAPRGPGGAPGDTPALIRAPCWKPCAAPAPRLTPRYSPGGAPAAPALSPRAGGGCRPTAHSPSKSRPLPAGGRKPNQTAQFHIPH